MKSNWQQAAVVCFIGAINCFLLARVSHGQDHTRIVMLQMPVKTAAAVRVLLNDPAKGSSPETMTAALKQQGVASLAGFEKADPWRNEPLELSAPMGGIDFGGERARDLGVNLTLEGGKGVAEIEEMLSTEVALPAGGKSYLQLQNLGNRVVVRPGRWRERACWGDAGRSIMIWQLSSLDAHQAGGGQAAASPRTSLHVEMHWLRVAEADLPKLAQSKPETREKAFQWLSARARLWKECGFWVTQDDKAVWSETAGKLSLRGQEAVAEETPFAIEGGFSGADEVKMEWKATLGNGRNEWSRVVSATVTPGVWEFITIEGLPDANVVACRLSRD
jgi:hypothetical protein